MDNPLSHIRVCRDDIRHQFGQYWVPEREWLVTAIEEESVYRALDSGLSVILDATNLNPKTLKKWEDMVTRMKSRNNGTTYPQIEIEYKRFDTDLEECLRRDALRGIDCRGEKVIRDFHKRYCTNTETPKIELIVQDPNCPKVIIVDIDGTVAKTNGRGHYEYHKVDTDLPNKPVIERVENYLGEGRGTIIFLSGREDSCRQLTYNWLMRHIVLDPSTDFQLFMRKTGDHRKDCIIKKEIFDAEIKGKYFVEFCLDDRNQVVDLWRAMGLTVHQVCSREEGNF